MSNVLRVLSRALFDNKIIYNFNTRKRNSFDCTYFFKIGAFRFFKDLFCFISNSINKGIIGNFYVNYLKKKLSERGNFLCSFLLIPSPREIRYIFVEKIYLIGDGILKTPITSIWKEMLIFKGPLLNFIPGWIALIFVITPVFGLIYRVVRDLNDNKEKQIMIWDDSLNDTIVISADGVSVISESDLDLIKEREALIDPKCTKSFNLLLFLIV